MPKRKVASPPGNVTRGEETVTLDGFEYTLRPSFEARSEFQERTGKGTLQLAQGAAAQSLTEMELAEIIAACIRAGGRANGNKTAEHVNTKRIGELISEMDGGIMVLMQKVKLMLFLAVTGGYKASGERKPVAAKPAP